MNFKEFANSIEKGREAGHHVFVQCLPKMGSTALSRSLPQALHEFEMETAPSLMNQRKEAGFDQQRRQWLHQRKQQLGHTVDVCTSLFLLTAELEDQELRSHGHQRLVLNRSLRPWLRSISNWSFQHASHPMRQTWANSYRQFVAVADQELFSVMPKTLTDLSSAVRFWIPVWLVYQRLLDTNVGEDNLPPMICDSNTLIPINANISHFSKAFLQRFDLLIPAMPDLTISPNLHRSFRAELHNKLIRSSPSITRA
jgi:hypothetical protein